MRSDEEGVAGFFEDLPVLAFVLCGVMLLVSSAFWTSAQLAAQREAIELDMFADRALGRIAGWIGSLGGEISMPDLESIRRSNLSQLVQELLGSVHFLLNITSLADACAWWMLFGDGSAGSLTGTASATTLLNARDGTGFVLILEVTLIVWRT